jgi:hypothetical protein
MSTDYSRTENVIFASPPGYSRNNNNVNKSNGTSTDSERNSIDLNESITDDVHLNNLSRRETSKPNDHSQINSNSTCSVEEDKIGEE